MTRLTISELQAKRAEAQGKIITTGEDIANLMISNWKPELKLKCLQIAANSIIELQKNIDELDEEIAAKGRE